MDLTDIFLLLSALLCLLISLGALALRFVGFSFMQGAAITTAFLFFGFWNPVGWIVLILCIISRYEQLQRAMQASQARGRELAAGARGRRRGSRVPRPRPELRRGRGRAQRGC